mgnify:CR=1 FL=1
MKKPIAIGLVVTSELLANVDYYASSLGLKRASFIRQALAEKIAQLRQNPGLLPGLGTLKKGRSR